jgi:hypothetical protein
MRVSWKSTGRSARFAASGGDSQNLWHFSVRELDGRTKSEFQRVERRDHRATPDDARVHPGAVDGMALCRMFNHAIARQGAPRYLSSDNDPLFEYHRWQANLRILDVQKIKTVPYTPISHPFVERLIGTIRREYLDQTLFWNSVDLESKLLVFSDYYNLERVHSAVAGATPEEIGGRQAAPLADLSSYRWQSHCQGLYQLPTAA